MRARFLIVTVMALAAMMMPVQAQYQSDFNAAMDEARELEEDGKYADALAKYEEAAVLNWKYGYSDQRNLTRKITSLYGPAGRTDDGPSVINNDKVTLSDYSGYRFLRENPIYKADKNAGRIQILRVCCSEWQVAYRSGSERRRQA